MLEEDFEVRPPGPTPKRSPAGAGGFEYRSPSPHIRTLHHPHSPLAPAGLSSPRSQGARGEVGGQKTQRLTGMGAAEKRTLKVLVVGNGGVGKTSMIRRFCDGVRDPPSPPRPLSPRGYPHGIQRAPVHLPIYLPCC